MSNQTIQQKIGDDDKLTPIMIYANHYMVWGKVFSKKAIRVNTWLYTEMAPTYMKIYDAQLLMIGGTNSSSPSKFPIIHVQTSSINAYHLMPPFSEDVDYDPDELNRKLVPIAAFSGYFRFDGFMRMAELTTVDKYLEAAKGEFISFYDVKMTCPILPSIKGITAPMALLRQSRIAFADVEN